MMIVLIIQTERAAEFKDKFIAYLESLMEMQEEVHIWPFKCGG